MMNANDHRITWCLNWGEDAISGWSACYCVSPDQERERRELRSAVYHTHMRMPVGNGGGQVDYIVIVSHCFLLIFCVRLSARCAQWRLRPPCSSSP